MAVFKLVLENIDKGMAGQNVGLPMGLPKLSSYVCDVQKGRYDLIAGKTSSGKTAFADQCYVLNPFNYSRTQAAKDRNVKLDILYHSLEISAEEKFAKMAVRQLYEQFGIVSDFRELLSLGNYKMSPELRQKVEELKPWFDELEERVSMMDTYTTPDAIGRQIMEFASNNGTFKDEGGRTVYTPNHPNHFVIVLVDTINLIEPGPKQTLKEAMDDLSKKFIWFRNVCKFTLVPIQQFNANVSDPRRTAQGNLEPISDDIEDSKRPSKDCNTFIAIFDPFEVKIKNHRGYDITRLRSSFRQIQVLKNRNGERGVRLGLHFAGNLGLFQELPKGEEMTDADYLRCENF